MPTRINILYRIILTIGIQIQPIPIVGVFIQKSSNYRIIKPCPEIVLACYRVILFPCEGKAVWYGFFFTVKLPKASYS